MRKRGVCDASKHARDVNKRRWSSLPSNGRWLSRGYGGQCDVTILNKLTLMQLSAGVGIGNPCTAIRWPHCEAGSG